MVLDQAIAAYREVERRLARRSLARLTTAVPRTVRWAAGERGRSPDPARPPVARLTAALVGHVAMDESIMALAVGPNRFPRRADYERVGAELVAARAVFAERGWLDHPERYHRTPPSLDDPEVTTGWALGRRYERLWWESGFDPPEGVPGGERWSAMEANRTATAWVLRHRDGPRPWLVCIHGFAMGSTFVDLVGLRAGHLHDALGVNVAAIVLPAHGPRRSGRIGGEEFLGFDLMNAVHGMSQGLWDIRRLLGWVRAQEPSGVGVFGVSLGGLMAALTAAFEADLDLVLAGIPLSDFPALIHHHAPHHLRLRGIEHRILDGTAQDVHRVVSPLAMPVAAPLASRAIFAGLGDRLVTTDQAERLWHHWERPETCWFPGNHVGYLWSGAVWGFVDEVLTSRGLSA